MNNWNYKIMNVPPIIISEIYDLLLKYDETPKINKITFVDWYSSYIFDINLQLKSVIFTCMKPFFCYVSRNTEITSNFISDEMIGELNKELCTLSEKAQKIKIFW